MKPPFAVVGVDPGGRDTGVVGRVGSGSDRDALVLDLSPDAPASGLCPTIRRASAAWVPDPAYLALVVDRVAAMIGRLRAVCAAWELEPLVAVEDLGGPADYRRGPKREPAGLIGLAAVWGAVCSRWPDAIQVPQGFNGGGPRQAYPAELWGDREGPAGQGILRDARSAWDVAGAAIKLLRFGGPF